MGFIARGHPLSELSGSSQIHPGDIARAVTCGPILSLQWDIPCPSWKTYRPHWSDKLSTDLWQCNHCYLSWEHLGEFFAFRTCSGCVSWVRSPNNPFTKKWLTWLTSAPPSCQSAILQGNIDGLVGYLVAVCFHTHTPTNFSFGQVTAMLQLPDVYILLSLTKYIHIWYRYTQYTQGDTHMNHVNLHVPLVHNLHNNWVCTSETVSWTCHRCHVSHFKTVVTIKYFVSKIHVRSQMITAVVKLKHHSYWEWPVIDSFVRPHLCHIQTCDPGNFGKVLGTRQIVGDDASSAIVVSMPTRAGILSHQLQFPWGVDQLQTWNQVGLYHQVSDKLSWIILPLRCSSILPTSFTSVPQLQHSPHSWGAWRSGQATSSPCSVLYESSPRPDQTGNVCGFAASTEFLNSTCNQAKKKTMPNWCGNKMK